MRLLFKKTVHYVQGNLLTGAAVAQAIVASYTGSNAPFEERLLHALVTGELAGGDKRGKQSAAMLIVDIDEYPYVDIRVDDHEDPVKELRRLWNIHKVGLPSIYREWVEDLQNGRIPESIAKEDEDQ